MDTKHYIQLAICMIPAVWIGFAFAGRAVFMLKGYPAAEGLLMGCLFGPLGVIIGLLVPRHSEKVFITLRNIRLLFAFVVFSLYPVLQLIHFFGSNLTGFLIGGLAECLIVAIGIYLIRKGRWR